MENSIRPIRVSDSTHHRLSILKAQKKAKDFDEIIQYLLNQGEKEK